MDFLLVAISVVVSLAADIVFDLYILKNYKISGRNKNDANKQDILRELRNKISALEKKIDFLSQNDNSAGTAELKKEVEALKRHLSNESRADGKSNNANDDMMKILREMAKRIAGLEESVSRYYPVDSSDSRNLENQIIQLNQEIVSLKQRLDDQNQISQQNRQLQETVAQLYQEINHLKIMLESQQKEQRNEKPFSETRTVSVPPAKKVSQLPFVLSAETVIPDRNYVKTLQSGLLSIQNDLGSAEYEHCRKKLQALLDNGDFDDCEEIMNEVHEIIKKYIYGSNTKVSAEEWKHLEKYIKNAGYAAVPVRAGDDITPYKTYFERPIAASGGVTNTIKQIQLQPFVLFYEDSGEKEMIKLCGKCTYYK